LAYLWLTNLSLKWLWIILAIVFATLKRVSDWFSLLRELVSIDLQGIKNNENKVGGPGIVEI
jgi:hypothetical protein